MCIRDRIQPFQNPAVDKASSVAKVQQCRCADKSKRRPCQGIQNVHQPGMFRFLRHGMHHQRQCDQRQKFIKQIHGKQISREGNTGSKDVYKRQRLRGAISPLISRCNAEPFKPLEQRKRPQSSDLQNPKTHARPCRGCQFQLRRRAEKHWIFPESFPQIIPGAMWMYPGTILQPTENTKSKAGAFAAQRCV